MNEIPWIDILKEAPAQGQRILAKMLGGQVRLVTYNRFNYNHWPIAAWKRTPDGNGQRQGL